MPDDSDQNQDDKRTSERPEREAEAPQKKGGLPMLGNQTALAEPFAPGQEMAGEGPAAPPDYPDSLLNDRGVYGRGNAPVRIAIAQRLQQTYGNRTAQRMLQRLEAGSATSSALFVQRQGKGVTAQSPATTTFDPVANDTYTVKGTTLQDAVDDMSGRDEAGKTDWNPTYSADYDENGKVKSAKVKVKFTVTMPNWPGAAKLNKAAKAEWDRFVKALRKHEDGHVTHAKDKFKNAANRLIGKTQTEAEEEWAKILKEVQDDSDDYDKGNDHGEKEGTIIDVDAGAPPPKTSSSSAAESPDTAVAGPDTAPTQEDDTPAVTV